MTSANLPINLETTPLFKDYVSNVKKQLVKTKQNSESKRQGTRLQVARKSTSWHQPIYKLYTYDSTAKSPTPITSGTTNYSTSPFCEQENGAENGSDEKNEEKERARSDGIHSPVDDHRDRQITSDSPSHIQHSPKDITEDKEKEKEEEDEEEEEENPEDEEDVCKQISRVISMAASESFTPEISDRDDKTTSISSLASEFDNTYKLDNEHSVKIEEEGQTQNEDSSSSLDQHFNQYTSFSKKAHHNHEYNNLNENKEEDPEKEGKEKDLNKQSSNDTSNSMETAALSISENTETADLPTSVPCEGTVDIKQQERDKNYEEKEKLKRKLSNDNTEHVSREKTTRNCSPPPESFKEEAKPC